MIISFQCILFNVLHVLVLDIDPKYWAEICGIYDNFFQCIVLNMIVSDIGLKYWAE